MLNIAFEFFFGVYGTILLHRTLYDIFHIDVVMTLFSPTLDPNVQFTQTFFVQLKAVLYLAVAFSSVWLFLGGCYGPLFWKRCVPSELMEHSGRGAGFCVYGGYTGVSSISGRKSNLRHPESSPSASNPATTQVQR